MKPILSVTLNAAVDKTYTVPGFALDRVHRPTEMRVSAGGKGINVARVYRTLGGEAEATGFLGGTNGDYLARALQAEGIPDRCVRVAGESRICIAILDPLAGTQTEINENGPQVSPDECDALLARLRELLPGYEAVVLSGSIPPGVSSGIYAEIIQMAQAADVPAILDASGASLAQGVAASPFLAKPNVHELAVLNVGGDGWGSSAQAVRRKFGVELAIVTGGLRGAVMASAAGVWEAIPPPVAVVSAVGSGDSLTAAFLWSYRQHGDLPEALRVGVAAGAANAQTSGPGFCTREQILALAPRVQVNKIG